MVQYLPTKPEPNNLVQPLGSIAQLPDNNIQYWEHITWDGTGHHSKKETGRTMKAVVVDEVGGSLNLRDVSRPEPGQGEVLLRVRACAVDQFDLSIRYGKVAHAKFPIVLGHEIAGEIAGLGPGVQDWQVGQRVTSTLYLTCGRCRNCRGGRETICENFIGYLGIQTPGGYAEYTVVPQDNLLACMPFNWPE